MKYTYYIDRKCTVWVREYHEFETENGEEFADKVMSERFINEETDDTFIYQEVQYDTLEDMTTPENQGNPVAEIYGEKSEPINTK